HAIPDAPGLAVPCARRRASGPSAESGEPVGAGRPLAFCTWPPVHPNAAGPTLARIHVSSRTLGYISSHAAAEIASAGADRRGLGKDWADPLAAAGWRTSRRGDEINVCDRAGPNPESIQAFSHTRARMNWR